jgi:hypothetical protein
MVVAAVLLSTLETARAVITALGWPLTVHQLMHQASSPLGATCAWCLPTPSFCWKPKNLQVNMNSTPQVYFIGAGPGDPDLITVRGRDLVSRADLVLYAGSLVPAEVVACARPGPWSPIRRA